MKKLWRTNVDKSWGAYVMRLVNNIQFMEGAIVIETGIETGNKLMREV